MGYIGGTYLGLLLYLINNFLLVSINYTCLTIAWETSPFLSDLKTSSSVTETKDLNSALLLFRYGTKN